MRVVVFYVCVCVCSGSHSAEVHTEEKRHSSCFLRCCPPCFWGQDLSLGIIGSQELAGLNPPASTSPALELNTHNITLLLIVIFFNVESGYKSQVLMFAKPVLY